MQETCDVIPHTCIGIVIASNLNRPSVLPCEETMFSILLECKGSTFMTPHSYTLFKVIFTICISTPKPLKNSN